MWKNPAFTDHFWIDGMIYLLKKFKKCTWSRTGENIDHIIKRFSHTPGSRGEAVFGLRRRWILADSFGLGQKGCRGGGHLSHGWDHFSSGFSLACLSCHVHGTFHHLSQDLTKMFGADWQIFRSGSILNHLAGGFIEDICGIGQLGLEFSIWTSRIWELSSVQLVSPLINLADGAFKLLLT